MAHQPSEKEGDDLAAVLEETLGDLARNIIAISQGGGKPAELVDQIIRVAESLITYNEVFGTRPDGELIRRALSRPVSSK